MVPLLWKFMVTVLPTLKLSEGPGEVMLLAFVPKPY